LLSTCEVLILFAGFLTFARDRERVYGYMALDLRRNEKDAAGRTPS
jgi:hypothetical protein